GDASPQHDSAATEPDSNAQGKGTATDATGEEAAPSDDVPSPDHSTGESERASSAASGESEPPRPRSKRAPAKGAKADKSNGAKARAEENSKTAGNSTEGPAAPEDPAHHACMVPFKMVATPFPDGLLPPALDKLFP